MDKGLSSGARGFDAGCGWAVMSAGLLVLFALCPGQLVAEATSCESLAQLKLENTEITTAQSVPEGPLTVHGFGPARAVMLPAFCRVAGRIHPSADSDIAFEVWLPAQWNGRFEATGNGGLAGMIVTVAMAGALHDGYATAGTDTGHTGTAASGDWALV